MTKDLTTELKRGTLELILLRLLATRPTYGYDLVRRLAADGGPTIKEGTVYPVLYRLEDDGWIAPEWQAPRRGVPRKIYHLTDAGHDRLRTLTAAWRGFADWVDGHLAADEETRDV